MSDRIAARAVSPPALAGTVADRIIGSAARSWAVLRLERRGVALVEFAITLPLVIALLLPLVDLSMGFYRKTQLMTAAEAGAQYAWLKGYSSATIKTVVQGATSLPSSVLQASDITVTLSCKCVDKTTSSFTSTTPAGTPPGTATTVSDCTGPSNVYTCAAGSVSTLPGAYVTVTIDPSSSPAHDNYTPLFTYGIFGNGVRLVVSSTVRIN